VCIVQAFDSPINHRKTRDQSRRIVDFFVRLLESGVQIVAAEAGIKVIFLDRFFHLAKNRTRLFLFHAIRFLLPKHVRSQEEAPEPRSDD